MSKGISIGDRFSKMDDPFMFESLPNPDRHPTAPIVSVTTPWHDGEGTMTRQLTRSECEHLRDFLVDVLRGELQQSDSLLQLRCKRQLLG